MAKLISTLELRYPMIQFLIIPFIHERSAIQSMNTRKPVQPAQVTTLVSKIQQISFQSKHSKCTSTYAYYLTESVSYF